MSSRKQGSDSDDLFARRGLIWATTPPSEAELRRAGFTVIWFGDLKREYIAPVLEAGTKRLTLDNAAVGLLELFDSNSRLAILGVPAATAGDLQIIYSCLVEPGYRRDTTLLLGVDRSLDALDAVQFVAPDMGYAWTLERLMYIAQRYALGQRRDGIPPLTPIEDQLLRAMRSLDLNPDAQYGIGPYRADFAFPAQRLVVEADGRAWHDAQRDARRDAHLHRLGWAVLRLTGSEIYRAPDEAARRVAAELRDRAQVLHYSDVSATAKIPWWRRLINRLFVRRRHEWMAAQDVAQPDVEIPEWKAQLDPDQRAAVEAHEGVVQVIAPAGSGKTLTMITRVQELVTRGVPANRILCTTFNKAASAELSERLKAQGLSHVEVRNFHSLGHHILSREGLLRPNVGTISFPLWRRLARQAMQAVGDGVWLDAPIASDAVSNYKLDAMVDPDTAIRSANTPIERTAATIYQMYEAHLQAADQHDFDDLILRAVMLLREDAAARSRWQGRWEAVLVDEYQDIEPAQELLVRLVAAPEDSVFAVGDEDQCIYSWRRASVEGIVMLDTVYPGLERFVLGTSYRCPAAVVEAAANLIRVNTRRFPKQIAANPENAVKGIIEHRAYADLLKAAAHVADLLEGFRDSPNAVVVLARTSRLLREVAYACIDREMPINVPAKVLRPSDAERAVLAYLRVAASPATATTDDIRASFRVPNRYLFQGGEEPLMRLLRSGMDVEAAAVRFAADAEGWRVDKIKEWGSLVATLGTSGAEEAVRTLRTRGGLDKHYASVEQMSPHDAIEVEILGDLQVRAAGKTLAEMADAMDRRIKALTDSNDESGIELNTIHGAKGREWDTVVLFAADADQLPHYRAIYESETSAEFDEAMEGERRLMYVAITRTQRRLVVISTGPPSPFLREAGIAAAGVPLPTYAEVEKARAAREAAARSENAIRAEYGGRCSVCRKRFTAGDKIHRIAAGWVHLRCAGTEGSGS